MNPTKPAEPIEMPFGMWALVDPSNHALDGGPDPPRRSGIYGRYEYMGKTMRRFIELLRSLVSDVSEFTEATVHAAATMQAIRWKTMQHTNLSKRWLLRRALYIGTYSSNNSNVTIRK